MALSKTDILDADDLPREEVAVPEWGGAVLVRTMTAAERDSFEARVIGTEGVRNLANIRATLCAQCIVDDQGKRLFTDGDIDLLGQKSAAAVDRVFAACQRLNGLTQDDVEELAKNLPGDPEDDSSSG